MVARLLWEQDAAGSNPVTSTSLSVRKGFCEHFFFFKSVMSTRAKLGLDANRIPGSAFYLSFCLRCFCYSSTQDTPHCKTGFTNDLAFSEWSERSPAALLRKIFQMLQLVEKYGYTLF